MEKLNKYIKKFFWFVNCATVVQALCLAYLFLIIIIYFILVADFFQPQQTAKFLQNHNSIILSLLYIFFIGLILKLTTFYNYQSVIKLIEKKFGNFNYKLSSVFTAYNDKINNQFVEYLTDELIADFKSLKYSDYRKSTNNILKSSIIICGIAIILQALLFYIFRPRIIIFFKNYFQPKNYITATIFKITPQNIIVLKGESIKIQIQIAGADQDKTPDMIIVNNNNYASKKINLKNFEVSKNKYEYTFSNVLENFEFYIQTQFSKSDRYYVKTYNSPHLEIEQISTQPPKYTGLPIDYYYSAPEKLNVYKGSKIQLKCVVNFDNSNLKILFNSKQFSPKKENNRIFDFEWTVNQSGIVRFNFKSPLADAIENFKSLKIDISADNYPSVRFSYPNKPELQLSEDMLIPFNIYAEDDFGISAGELYINAPSKQDIIKLEFKNIGNYYEAFYTVDFSKYNLLPGDEIFYFAKVYDNDEISGFKSAQSEKYKILMPTMLDIFNNLNKELETTTNVFDALKKKNTELLKSTQKIIDDLVRKGATDWATQKQIKELIDQQRKIADEISQLQENVKNAIANYQQAKEKLGADTLEKIQKLTALMNELANSEIGKELFKLEKALNAATQKERLENLNAALFDKEQFTNKLEKTISLLNQLKFQNLLNNLQKSITDILKKQSQISENLQENNFNNAAHNQNLTTKELSKMQNTLTELANSEQSTNINDTIKQLEESLKKLTEKSEKFAELLKEFNTNNKRNISPDDLQKESQNLTRQLSSLANQINSMLSMYANLEYQKFQKELDEIILKMINLQKSNTEFSRLINDYIKILENPYLDFNEDNDISKHIGFIENLQNYVYFQSLKYFNLTIQSFVFDLSLVNDFKNISDEYSIIKKHLTNMKNLKTVDKHLKNAMKQNSELVFKLIKTKEALNKDNNNANSQNLSERLEQLAAAQQALNSMALNIDNMTAEQLQQLAYEQSLIRQALEQMMNSQNTGDAFKKKLEELVKEMNRIENELKKGNRTKEVKETQKSFYEKMLDISRSLKKDTESEQREGRAALAPVKKTQIKITELKTRVPSELLNFPNNKIPQIYSRELQEYYNQLLKMFAE